jgi:hypothetical protein
MAKSNNSFIKKQKAENKRKKRLEKLEKKHNKKSDSQGTGWDSMIAYVDKNGNITNEPPEAPVIKDEKQNSINK